MTFTKNPETSKALNSSKAFYSYCKFCHRYRAIAGLCDDKKICSNCALFGDRKITPLPDQVVEREKTNITPKKKKSRIFYKRDVAALGLIVLRLLRKGVYTRNEIYIHAKEQGKEITKNMIDYCLSVLIKAGKVVHGRHHPYPSLYTSINRKEALNRYLGDSMSARIIQTLSDRSELTVSEIASILQSSRASINRWVKKLEAQSVVITDIRPIKGKKGNYKVCQLKNGYLSNCIHTK